MTTITIASQNLAAKAKSWQRKTFDARLDAIGEGIDYYRPAVFCAQEAGSAEYVKKLTNLLHNDVRGDLRRAPHGGRWRYIWYDNERLALRTSGLMSLNRLGTKHAAWAKLTSRRTGETFFITSVHLSQGGESVAQSRYTQGDKLLARSAQLNPHKHPEIHAGDYNSFDLVGKVVFQPHHYYDALSLAKGNGSAQHAGYNSFNGRTTVVPHPSTQKLDGQHDDHIYVSATLRHRVSHWSQRPSVQASDHNIIAVKVQL